MATLQDIAEQYKNQAASAIHLLLVANTKLGKTDYVAQAAKDGYTILYVDRDNGITTLLDALKDDPAAQARIHYFNPVDMVSFIEGLLTSPVVRYNNRTRAEPNFSTKDDERIVEIRPSRIPMGVIFALDSWTSYVGAIMSQQAAKANIDLTDVEKFDRKVYGPSGFYATQMAQAIQAARFHVIVQAHPDVYERKEKPTDRTASTIEEKDMIIRETTEIPISTSKPHGFTIGKHFNQIGWLVVDRANRRLLDFRVIEGRIGGGTPNGIDDPRGKYRFANLFGKPPVYPPLETWLEEMEYGESKKRAQAATSGKILGSAPAKASTPAVAPATPPATTAPSTVVTLPSGPLPKLPGIKS